jgi:hypothetical protein
VLLGGFAVAAKAQVTLAPSWYQQSPANSPSQRYIHAMSYDATHSQVVLFGGFGNGYLSDTWLWNGTNWTQANPANSPSARAAHAMAYDSTHGQVVMFGGLASASSRLGDTWIWDGTNWNQANPANSPSARDGAVLVDYPGTGLLLFGGTNGTDLNDTWLWNGTNWTQATSGNNPTPRADYGMAFDPEQYGGVILFGGSTNGNYVDDTYIWNTQLWFEQDTATTPPARYAQGMVYDDALGQVIMFGGYNGSFLNDTWAFSQQINGQWAQLVPNASPSGRYAPNGMTYDSGHSQVVLFGGLGNTQTNDTWVFGVPGNFGNVNVCSAGATTPVPCSETLAFTYNVASTTTFSPAQVVTQGTSGLDFTLASSTCTGTISAGGSCTVTVTFAPLAPGLRMGAVNLPNSGAQFVSTPIYGVGQGPAAAVAPGSSKNVATGLNTPYGVAVDAAGNTYITDSVAGQVLKVAQDGTSTPIGVSFTTPTGVAVDGQGNVYVTDQGANAIVQIPSGCIPNSCQSSLPASELVEQETAVAVDGAGDVFFTSLNPAQVTEIPVGCTSTNCVNVVWTPPASATNSQPNGIALDAAGDLFIADSSIAQLYEVPAGCTDASCQVMVGTGLGVPTGVAVDAAGDLFVSNSSFGVLEIPAGCASFACETTIFAGGAPQGVAVDAQGDVIVPLSTGQAVQEVVRSQTESLNFPTTTVGSTSTASVTLQNVGNQPLQAESPGLISVSGASYSNTAGPGTPPDCSGTSSLAPGGECNVSILYNPQSYIQPNTGTATFATNSLNAASASQTVSLFGMGAKPVQNFYQLTVTEPGSGSGTVTDLSGAINCTETTGTSSGTCSASLPGSGVITFTATASGNSTFQGWGGACANAGTNSQCSIVLTAATTITANFANPVTYPLTVTTSGTGSGTVTDNLAEIACSRANGATLGLCSGPYPSGTQVTLTASATNNSLFAGWGGACASSGAGATCIVTINSALNVSASFVATGSAQSGTLKPITAGVVYGQGGSFTSNAAGDSAGTLASPNGVAIDGSGNLYVADSGNNRVLFYPAGSTTPTRVYGQGGSFTSNTANNGGISANSLNNPEGIAVDSGGNLYVADQYNNRVLFYPAGSTTATRVYGQFGSFSSAAVDSGGVSANNLSAPAGVALDSGGNLYIADTYNNRVLFYPAGSTTATQVYGQSGSFTSYGGNIGGITANTLSGPAAVALDSSGDLYVADQFNNRVLFYPANSTTAVRAYGQGGLFTSASPNDVGVTPTSLIDPAALAVDASGGLYVVDGNSRVLFYPVASTTATRVYGQSGSFATNGYNNGGVSANSLAQPAGVALDNNGNVYIADNGNNRVLEFGSFGHVNACPASQTTPAPCSRTVTYSYAPAISTVIGATQVVTQGATGLDFKLGSGNTCTGGIGAETACTVNVNFTPLAPGLRKGAVEIFDNNGNPLASSPIYGVGQEPELVFGLGTQTTVNTGAFTLGAPKGMVTDAAGNLFISDTVQQRVIKIAPSGAITTVGVGLQFPQEMAEDGAGDLFIADNNLNEIVEVPAGCTTSSCQQVLGANLRSQLGVAVDGAGNVFIGDYLDGEVVKSPAGCTASACQTIVYGPGAGSNPVGITLDSAGDLYVADFGLKQVVEVPAGCASSACQLKIGSGFWSKPDGVTVDAAGDVFVADAGLDEIVEAPAGCTSAACLGVVLSGIQTVAVAADAAGDLFVDDLANSRVIELSRLQLPSLSFAQTNVGSTSTDSPKSINLQNIGNQPLTGSVAFNLSGNFTQTADLDCSTAFPLAPGASCIDSFSFIPQAATFLTGTAVYTDNNLNGSPATQTITLSGTGAVGGVAGTVAVPNVVGQAQIAATAPITAVGLALGTVTTESSSSVASGSIISQNPAAGTQVNVGSTVNLLVSTGLPQLPPNPLSLENNYFLTGDYVSAGVTLRGTGTGGMAAGTINIPAYTQSSTQGVPAGADIIDAFLYWQTLESTPLASSTNGTFNGYPIVGQQIGNDIPNYVDGAFTGTIRSYRADVNLYLPIGVNGVRFASGAYTVSLPDSGGTELPLTEGASLVMIYRVLSPNFPLKSVVIYDGSALPTAGAVQVVQGFYDAVGGANGTGKNTNLFASNGSWNTSVNSVTLGQSNQYTAPLNPAAAYAAVILSTPVNNSDNDGILDAWKTGPTSAADFHAGQPGYYDVKTNTWVGLPGAKHGQKDLFVQLDYMCGSVLSNGSCDPTQENLFPSPDANGNDPLAMVQQAFAQSGVVLHLQVGNAVPEDTCVDNTTSTPAQLCQFPNQPGVIGWKNSLEFSKLYPRNLASCLTGGDCTTRFPYGQKDSYHYVLFGHSLAIPAYNTRYATLTSITVTNGITTLATVDRGTGINACPKRITIEGVLGNPALNGVYNTTGCSDSMHIALATPGVPNWSYPNNKLAEPVIGVTFGQTTSISGYSDLGGADSAVTLGQWLTYPNQDMSKRANVLAGTLFHEIGHTLGLGHGGLYYDTPNSYVPTFEANCKPNYQSIMNYLFQLDGVGPNQVVAYSNQALATLNETTAGSVTSLTDGSGNAATFPTSAWYVPYTTGTLATPATLHCDGTPLAGESVYRVDAPISPIAPPWSNGQDLDGIGALQTEERGFNDLANLDLRQVGATGGEFASLATELSFGSSVAPLNITAGGTVALGSGGTVALGSGGTVTLGSGGVVTLGSGGTVALGSGGTVTLGSGGTVTLGSGGTITPGSNGTVALGSGGTITLSSSGVVTLGSGGTVALGSGGTVTLGSGGTIALGNGDGTVTIPSSGGSYTIDGSGGTVTLGSGGTVALGSGGTVTLGSGGVVALGSGGTVALGSGGTVTLGSGGVVALGSGGVVALGSGGTVALGSGGTVTLGSGGTVTLGSGGTVTLGSGGTVTLGSGGVNSGAGGTVTLGSGGEATLGAGGTVTLGSGGTVALGSGGVVTLGSGGTVALGSGGTVALGSGGTASLSEGGVVALGSGGTVTLGSGGTVTLGSGGTVTLGSGGLPIPIGADGSYTFTGGGGTVTLGSGGTVTLGSGGVVTLGSGGTVALGSGGVVALGSGGTVTLGSGGVVTLGSGGTVTLGSGGTVTLGSGGVVTLGSGGSVIQGTGSEVSLGSVNNITSGSGGPTSTELTYETANSVVRVPTSPTETITSAGVWVYWKVPAFGVVQTYTIYRSSNGATPIVIGSVSGVNGFPPATQFLDTNPDLLSKTVVYTITTTLVPDTTGATPRSSQQSAPAVLKNDQTITLGPLPSSVLITNPPTVTATAMSAGVANGLQVVFTATGSCAIGSQSIVSGISSAVVTLSTTGSCTVTGSQPGTTTFNAANSVSGTFMVLPQGSSAKSQTINFATLPNVVYGSTFSLSASSSVGQPVTFKASGPCTTSGGTNGVGVCSITATAAGNSTYSAASLTQSFTVYPAVLKVTANNLSIAYGQALPSLTYNYSGFVNTDSASVVSGVPALSTAATTASNAGSYPITVSTGTLATTNYSFLYVNGALTIQPASQTINFTTSPPTSAAYASTFTVAATGGASGNAVTFTSAGACSNSGATYKMTSGTGTCSVIANQAGNSNYKAATQVTKTVSAALAAPTVTFTGAPTNAAYQARFTVATTTNASTTATITSSGACTNTGTAVTMTSGTGTCSLTATWAADSNYSGTTAAQSTAATLVAQTITFTTNPPASAAYTSTFTVAATGGASGNPVTFTSAGACSNSGATFTMTSSTGTCSLIANQAGNSNYAAATPVTKAVTATGSALSLSTSSINFGTLYVGSIVAQTVTLTNTGTAPITINDPILSIVRGGDSSEFIALSLCPRPLAGGKSCTVTIFFLAGPYYTPQTATLQIMSNAPGSPQPVALSATVINPRATFNPTSLNFGTIKHGTSASMNVTLSNTGATPLSLTGISVTGTNAAYFTQTNACGTSLAAGAHCIIAVKFTPATTGTFNANLTVVDNAQASGGTQTVSLSGKGN